MILLPAIDLIDGKCVRLTKGVYEDKTVYEKDPLKMAKSIEKAGAKGLHIIDLDSALGKGDHLFVIQKIAEALSIPIQVGGGIRDEKKLKQLIQMGVERVILGTKAIQNPAWAREMIAKYPKNIAISLDCVGEELKISGWVEGIEKNVFDFLPEIQDVSTIIYTDISRDGTLQGPNVEMLEKFRKKYDGFLIAAGGIKGKEDFTELDQIGVDGVVIGKALYENKVTLEDIRQWRVYE